MNIFDHPNNAKIHPIRSVAGFLLVMAGIILFVDRYLRTGWLSYVILPMIGAIFFVFGVRYRNSWILLAGGVISGIGIGVASALSPIFNTQAILSQIGLISLYTGIGWLLVVITTAFFTLRPVWWGAIPAGVLIGVGYCLVFTPMRWFDFILYLALGTSLGLLAWGLVQKLIGLVIPGCLLLSTGPAIYFAWSNTSKVNPLVSTGIMLVWLAFGWALITVSGRILIHRFLWWPLIPGGILAMVGCGLYIGGDPDNAIGFISNTGSIGLMIFGLYLLLMRKGIHH